MRILYKYASRSRPDKFRRGLESIAQNSVSDNYVVLATLDSDDPAIEQYRKELRECSIASQVIATVATSKNKIDAINRDLNVVQDWDILVNMSDDMVFTAQGFDEVIRLAFDDNTDLFVHFSDGFQKSNISTMSIMGRKYFKRDGYIYHPEYKSLWCDVEATEVAKLRGCYKYMGDNINILTHLHVAWGKAEWDELYKRNENPAMWSHDEKLYHERKARNYEL
jgi:predicted DNA-binding protein with PD1-like motif